MLGAAPRVLLGWVSKVFMGPEGLTVAMRNGVSLYFGDATRPHAKWLSAARVLADPSSAGATYVDLRAPERPAAGTTAAGGLAGDTANGQSSTEHHRRDLRRARQRSRGSDQRWVGHHERHRVGGPRDRALTASSTAEPSTTEPSTTEPSTAATSPANPTAAGRGSSESCRRRTLTLNLRLRPPKSDSSGGG